MSSEPPIAFPDDVGNSFAEEFLLHPDFRVISGFLLGCVFWSAVLYASRFFFQHLTRLSSNLLRPSRSSQSGTPDVEAQPPLNEKNPLPRQSVPSSIHRIPNDSMLVFTLNLCFAFAGFAEFCSLLAYIPSGDTACAFTVAWGSMAAQAARLIGLVMLVLELHQRHGSNIEFYCLCAALVVGLSLVLAFTATNTGTIILVRTLGVSLCNRTQFHPTALLSSFGFILLELYVGGRFLGWNGLKRGFRVMLAKSANLHVARASSLLLLDILTVVPNAAIATNQLAQFVPFSFGALIVLAAFNSRISGKDVLPAVKISTPLLLSAQRSRTPTPLPQQARHPSSPVVTETPQGSAKPCKPEEDVIVLDSPYVPSRPVVRPRVSQPIMVPNSAPPRIGEVFADHQQKRQILPFQVQYAEQFERHIHTGPIVAPIRKKRQRPHVQVIIEDMKSYNRSQEKSSSVIGSDIIRMRSATTSATTERRQWSPDTYQIPSDTVSRGSGAVTPTTIAAHTPTTVRSSTMSSFTQSHVRSLSSSSRGVLSAGILSASTSRQSSSRKIRSPVESLKTPWRNAPRSSFASGRTFGGREELSVVVENQVGSSGSRRASRTSAKRLMISRPHSLRPTIPLSPQPSPLGSKHPAIPSPMRPSSAQHLTVPERLRSPASPGSPSSVRSYSKHLTAPGRLNAPTTSEPPPSAFIPPSVVRTPAVTTSPPSASYERAWGSGRLRGPRTPPTSASAPNLRSGWPIAGPVQPAHRQRQERTRSGSCPELPPLDFGVVMLRPVKTINRA